MSTGLEIAAGYYRDVVAPLLEARWPGLPHAAGRWGGGSEVLGLDDPMSRDHDWGLRLTLLVEAGRVPEVAGHLAQRLPDNYAGLPTRFAVTRDPVTRSRVTVTTLAGFSASCLGLETTGELTAVDWLCLTGQSVLEATVGPVLADSLGSVRRFRSGLAWYPDDVWRYVVAAGWIRLGEDLPLLGRTGQRGDDLGSRVLAGRIAATAMHLAFLLARRWPPYPKWGGTVLRGLPLGERLVPALGKVLTVGRWQDRQREVAGSLEILLAAQRDAGLPAGTSATESFFGRPFLGVTGETASLLLASITDPQVKALPYGAGSVEQWVDSVAVLANPPERVRAARGYLGARLGPGLPDA